VHQDVCLEVGRLGKALPTALVRAGIRLVPRVDALVCPKVEIQGETLAAAFKLALRGVRNGIRDRGGTLAITKTSVELAIQKN
jgi:hypothetical protein